MKKCSTELVREWTEKIQKQMESGKSIAAWCLEESIPYKKFLYWAKRVKQPIASHDQIKRTSFIECSSDSQPWLEIHLEGAKLTLSKNFDRAALLFCLRVFGGH
jgi:hypothetical protein